MPRALPRDDDIGDVANPTATRPRLPISGGEHLQKHEEMSVRRWRHIWAGQRLELEFKRRGEAIKSAPCSTAKLPAS